jgi:hypothetical protein
MILPVDGVVEARLRSAIERGEAAVLTNDAGVRHLYDDDVVTRPMFCFGRAPIASYFTIGANPSADDFRAGRWGAGDLASQCFSYFDRVAPHDFFPNWEAALEPLRHGVSYVGGGLSHLDVSPRATKSLRAINKLGDAVINDFLAMARADASYLEVPRRVPKGSRAVAWVRIPAPAGLSGQGGESVSVQQGLRRDLWWAIIAVVLLPRRG